MKMVEEKGNYGKQQRSRDEETLKKEDTRLVMREGKISKNDDDGRSERRIMEGKRKV